MRTHTHTRELENFTYVCVSAFTDSCSCCVTLNILCLYAVGITHPYSLTLKLLLIFDHKLVERLLRRPVFARYNNCIVIDRTSASVVSQIVLSSECRRIFCAQ